MIPLLTIIYGYRSMVEVVIICPEMPRGDSIRCRIDFYLQSPHDFYILICIRTCISISCLDKRQRDRERERGRESTMSKNQPLKSLFSDEMPWNTICFHIFPCISNISLSSSAHLEIVTIQELGNPSSTRQYSWTTVGYNGLPAYVM